MINNISFAGKEQAITKSFEQIVKKATEYTGPGKIYAQKEIDAAKAVAAEIKAKAAERASVEYASPFATTASKAAEQTSVEYASPYAPTAPKAAEQDKTIGNIINLFG